MVELDKITIGNLLTIVTLLGIYAHASIKLSKLEGKLNIIFSWWCREVLPKTNDAISADEIRKFFR